MSRDDDSNNGAGNALKKDFGNILKHSKKMIKGFFRGGNRCNNGRRPPGGCPPVFKPRSPLLMLLYPKLIVAGVILLTLLFCGVSIYGLVIVILLTLILILI